MKRHYLLLVLTIISYLSFGQTNISFDRLTTKEGLAHNQVRAIVQDKFGFIWFGTTGGLQRYDGRTFTTYVHNPKDSNSLVADRIRTLITDEEGGIWIGTFGGGLSYLRDGNFTNYVHDVNDPQSISDNSIEALAFDASGNLWVGTRSGGLSQFKDGVFNNFQLDASDPESLSHNAVFSLLVDSKDRVWVGTYGGGLNLYNNGKFIKLRKGGDNGIVGDFVISLSEDDEGSIYVGTWQDGFSKLSFEPNSDAPIIENFVPGDKIKNSSVLASLVKGKEIYMGTWGAGLNILQENGSVMAYQNTPGDATSLSSNYIECFFQDANGNVWIGTYGGGVNRLSFSNFVTFRNQFKVKSLNSEFVTDILEASDGSLYIGTLGGGLNRYKDGSFTYYVHDPRNPSSLGDESNSIWNIIEDDRGSIWLATQSGVEELRNGKFFHYRYEDNKDIVPGNLNITYSIESTRDGGVLFGTWDGRLVKLKDGEYEVLFNVAKDNVTEANHPGFSIFQAENGDIWACFESYGLVHLKEDGTLVAKYFEWRTDKTNVPEPRSAIQSKFSKYVYAGTSLGVFRIDPETKETVLYNEKSGLVNNNVAGVMEDKNGIIWVSTMDGLSRLDPKTQSFENFDELDGLQGNQFVRCSWYVSDNSEKVYIGGTRGFNVFHPDSISIDRPDPKVVITGLQVLYKPVRPGESSIIKESIEKVDEIELSYEDKVFSFEFATINYNRLYQQYYYAYYLENYEDSWNFVGRSTFASYNNIPPGEYTFKVVSSKTGAFWDNPVKSIKIIIHPPWWNTWWARILGVLVFLGISYGFFIYRVRNIRYRNRILKKLVDKRTAELSYSNSKLKELSEYKDQMTSMIVHDLKNPLNTVFNMTDQPDVIRAAKRMLTLVTNMLDVQKFEEARLTLETKKVLLVDIVDAAVDQVKHSIDSKSITLRNEVLKKAFVSADTEIIERVIMNLLTNAVKFSPPNSLIEITALELPETWQLSIKDSGPGIPEGAKKTIFELYGQLDAKEYGVTPSTGLGLAFCKQAVQAHGGFIGVYSKQGEGATFYFTLPKALLEQEIEKPASAVDHNNHFNLSTDDKEYLSTFIQKLKHYEVYEFTKISKVIDEIESKNDNLTRWKQHFKNAVYSNNTEKFKALIDEV